MERKTVYQCARGHKTITIDPGTYILPMIIDCQDESCKDIASLSGEIDEGEATHQWYVPEKRRGLTKEDNRRYKKHGTYLKKINNEKEKTKTETPENDWEFPWTDDGDGDAKEDNTDSQG